MSGLALNNQSFEEPAAMDVEEILKVLGESSSSVLMLDSLFPMLRELGMWENLQNGDIGARFPRFMVKLLNAVTSIDYKVALILEDIQWMDAKTFILIKEIMKSCPNVLVLLLSRPIEEYPKELDELYQSIVQADRLEQIVLKQFDRQGTEALLRGYLGPKLKSLQQISPELVRDIYERSQGVPFAVKVLASSILQNSDTAMREIPKDALTAIVAQFDRLPIEAKAVLRVAAVAGQTFSLVDVYEVLKRGSFGVANNFNSSDDIRITLTKSDPYHFVTKSSMFNSVTMSFSHYLIQQGILSTIIPKEGNNSQTVCRLLRGYS
ncbi:hypothetical protein BC829DRAFT_42746 [Chytridium lagenaria]|nr:hypothetical protein BC829DRAFT_42746 [Chytridium lagenaria]